MSIEEWLDNNQLGCDIWKKKYCYNNESFEEWLDRVSGGLSEMKELIRQKKFLFGGRTLSNRGTGLGDTFSNCYCCGQVPDSLEDILLTAKQIGMTFKAQGGQGLSLSKIRPKDALIKNRYKSDGIVPFMEIFNTVTASVSQGSHRRGALMMSLDINHLEAPTFITIKSNTDKIQNANLSLEIDDAFMKCVKECLENKNSFEEEKQKDSPVSRYDLMMKTVYDWGEPGCIFLNRFKNYNLMQHVKDYVIEGANPCGEQPLPKHGACNLGSINLLAYVKNPFTERAYFDEVELRKDMLVIVRAMDDVLEENLPNHALVEQRKMAEKYRNLGIGGFGYADMLIALGLTYGSPKALEMTRFVASEMFRSALEASRILAEERGPAPGYSVSIWDSDIIKHLYDECDFTKGPLRNCSLISWAPCGSISTLLGRSGGAEPNFALEYYRTTKSLSGEGDKTYKVNADIVNQFYKVNGETTLPKYFVTSGEIPWKEHIDTQAVIQEFCDTAISKTVNLPNEISLKEIYELYIYAWEKGLKGVTIWRDGCKRQGILTKTHPSNTEEKTHCFDCVEPVHRSEFGTTFGTTHRKVTACGTLYPTFNRDSEGHTLECFVNTSKGGICQANMAAITRLISLNLRSGVKVAEIVDQLKGIVCPACVRARAKGEELDGISCPDILAKTLEVFHQQNSCCTNQKEKEDNTQKCPECGKSLRRESGCLVCECGWSKCS